MITRGKTNLDEVAARIVGAFPALDVFEQRLSLELYSLLAAGEAVRRELLAERLHAQIESVNRTLNAWPGVFSDSHQRIVGYWGLSIPETYASPHRLTIEGRKLSAWCAWDTLFLPQLLGKNAAAESTSPPPAGMVRLLVTPTAVEHVEPADAHVSFLLPGAAELQRDIVTTFCHFVHFFPSRRTGEEWAVQHPGTFILSVAEAHAIARRKNEAQYGGVLGRSS